MPSESYYSPAIQILTCQVTPLGPFWVSHNFTAPYWRLYWNPRPGASVMFAGRQTALEPSRFIMIPPDTSFIGRCVGHPSHLYIHFLAQSPYDTVIPGVYRFSSAGQLRQLAMRLHAIARQGSKGRELSMLALALTHAALCHIPASAMRSAPQDPRIVSAIALMDTRLGEPLPNPQLADHVRMSTNAFIRLFHQVMHVSPQQFYVRKRIDRACMQLHYSDLKLDQIAQQTGFCDRYHFTRAFTKLRGIGPAAFRRHRTRHPTGSGSRVG